MYPPAMNTIPQCKKICAGKQLFSNISLRREAFTPLFVGPTRILSLKNGKYLCQRATKSAGGTIMFKKAFDNIRLSVQIKN
jgi:hypothetical protein